MAKKRGQEGKRVGVRLILIPIALIGLTLFSFFGLRASVLGAQASLLNSAAERIALRVSAQLRALLDIGQQFRSAVVEEGDASYAAIKSLSDSTLRRYPFISAVTLAPGAIIRYSFPEENSSASIGHDLLDNPERMQALVQAVSKKQAVLQGPEVSAEGVDLAFLRLPVFKAQDLWGFISIAIDVDKMLDELALKDEFPGLRIACAARAEGSGGTRAFWGDERAGMGYSSPVGLGGDESGWSIAVASAYPASRAIWWGGAIAVLAVLGYACFIFFALRTRQRPEAAPRARQEHFDVSPFNSFASYKKKTDIDLAQAGASAGSGGTASAPPIEASQTSASQLSPVHVDTPAAAPARIDRAEAPISSEPEPESSEASTAKSRVESLEALASRPRDDTQEARPPSIPASAEAKTHTPATVLVVDDSEVNRELLVRMLTLKGYQVESIASGAHALAMLETHDFDVLLVDCIMPEMDGYALARAIRGQHTHPSAEGGGLLTKSASKIAASPLLVAMSPRHDAEEAEKCAQAGFDGLLIKPFTMTSLDQKIQEMLKISPRPGR